MAISVVQSGTVFYGINFYGATNVDWDLLGSFGPRTYVHTFTFPVAFTGDGVPTVTLALSAVSVVKGELKIHLAAASISNTSFSAQITTWDDCQIAGVGLQWSAFK